MLPYLGGGVRYAISTHTQFGIGKVISSPKRCRLLSYLKLTLTQWLDMEPVPQYKNYISSMENKKLWREVKDLKDIKKYWKNNEINKFLLNNDDILIKAGGCGNWEKSQQLLHNSKHVLRLLIGVGSNKGKFIVGGLRMKMTVVHDKTKIKKGIFYFFLKINKILSNFIKKLIIL